MCVVPPPPEDGRLEGLREGRRISIKAEGGREAQKGAYSATRDGGEGSPSSPIPSPHLSISVFFFFFARFDEAEMN